MQQFYGRSFPLATCIINILGCLLMGWLFFLTLGRLALDPTLRTAILTGGLGGFTTFSTFAMGALLLVKEGATLTAVEYVAASVLLGLAATRPLPVFGLRAARERSGTARSACACCGFS